MKKTFMLSSHFIFVTIILSCITFHGNAQEISPYLFGQNLWLTEGSEGRPGYIDELWPMVEESGATMIRIGGAGYDGEMPDFDTLTKWIKSIKSIGAEPLLQVSRKDTKQESAEIVKFLNSNPDTYVKYWSIGNEPYHLGKLEVDSISAYIKSHSTAMKLIDPTIKIMVPDLASYYNEPYEILLKDDELGVAGRDDFGNWYIDGVNFHNYPNAKDYNRADVIFKSVTKMKGMMMDLNRDLEYANEKYGRYGDDALIWGLTEFNITYDNPDDHSPSGIAVPSFINGQFWVDIFGMAMEYGAFTATPWCIQESDRKSTYFGYIGAPPNFIPHSTFYHMEMMSRVFKGEYIKMKTTNPYLKAFGSESENGFSILLMNQHEETTFDLDLSKLNVISEGVTISSVKPIKAVYKSRLKPESTLLLTFDKNGKKTSEMLYNLELAEKLKAPKVIE